MGFLRTTDDRAGREEILLRKIAHDTRIVVNAHRIK